MLAFMVRRLFQTCIVLVLVTVIAFSLLQIIPGDPALTILGDSATPAQVEALRHELGLDQPVLVQYVRWFSGMLRGDLGKSIAYREAVTNLIAARLPVTFHLGIVALVLSTVLS